MDTTQISSMKVNFFNETRAISPLEAEEPDTLESKTARNTKFIGKKKD